MVNIRFKNKYTLLYQLNIESQINPDSSQIFLIAILNIQEYPGHCGE